MFDANSDKFWVILVPDRTDKMALGWCWSVQGSDSDKRFFGSSRSSSCLDKATWRSRIIFHTSLPDEHQASCAELISTLMQISCLTQRVVEYLVACGFSNGSSFTTPTTVILNTINKSILVLVTSSPTRFILYIVKFYPLFNSIHQIIIILIAWKDNRKLF